MKKFLWITILGFVLAALAANGAPQPLAPPATPANAECDCSNLKALQIELRNALRLQEAMRNKIPELRALNHPTSISRYKTFTETDARRDLEPIPGYEKLSKADKALLQFDYDPQGFALSDPTHPPANKSDAELCALSAFAAGEFARMKNLTVCRGIGAALEAHEDVHKHSCERGFIAFFGKNGADRAQEEVEAYGAQIAVLRAEIAKVLEHANVRIETETNSRMSMPPNPLYTAIVVENRAVVPMSSVSVSGDLIKFEGEGKQTNNATVEGHCKFTGGLPFTITLRGSIETEGLEARIRLALMGTLPGIAMECATPAGTGHGMPIPVNVGGGTIPLITLPLENGAEKVFDQSNSPAAQQGPVRITGMSKIRLIFCEK